MTGMIQRFSVLCLAALGAGCTAGADPADMIIKGDHVVTMDASDTIIENGAVVVTDVERPRSEDVAAQLLERPSHIPAEGPDVLPRRRRHDSGSTSNRPCLSK